MFASVDADGNGTITRKDFEKVMADSQNFTYTRREIEEALLLFEANDANRDGNVDILRLEKWLLLYGKSAYSEEKIKDLLYQFPVSKDGKFNVSEFLDDIFPPVKEKSKVSAFHLAKL